MTNKLLIGIDAKCVDMKSFSTPSYKASLDAILRLRAVLSGEERVDLENMLDAEVDLGKRRAPNLFLENR